MKERYKTYLKLNLVSVFFIAVSFISISLAWFAYSGLVRTQTEIDVKAWHIEFDKNGQAVSNDIVISLSDIHPGMDPSYEDITIKNLGDSDAKLSYKIDEVRIFDEDLSIPFEFGSIEDKLSSDYPFSVNVSYDNKYLKAKTGESALRIGVSWPLDSDNDIEDSKWGSKAYEYHQNYPNSPAIKIIISLTAEQNTDDFEYNTGDILLYDINTDKRCNSLGGSCIKTNIINTNVNNSEDIILLPDLLDTYPTGTFDMYTSNNEWNVTKKDMKLYDIVNFISQDIKESYLVRQNLSDKIIGYVEYNNRFDTYINNVVKPYNSYFKFNSSNYGMLNSNYCYWINDEYDSSKGYAIVNDPEKGNIITPYDKSNTCRIAPLIVVDKHFLELDNN